VNLGIFFKQLNSIFLNGKFTAAFDSYRKFDA